MSSLQVEAAKVLDWARLLDVLAAHAQSSQGRQLCLTLQLESTLEEARARQHETTEMTMLRQCPEPFPSVGCPDIRDVLTRARKGACLEAIELRDCAVVLSAVEAVSRYVQSHRQHLPYLLVLAAPLDEAPSLGPLHASLEASVLPDGSLSESATPELKRLIHHAQELKRRMRGQLDDILHSRRYAEVLQETYFVQRQGRYVVPIKAEMQGRIPGILHDVSASGATVFLEPRELIELNNAIKVADLDVEREVRRILRELSALVAEKADMLEHMTDALARLDCVAAKAALGLQLGAAPVALNDRGRVWLRQARHPLLLLSKDTVVANDILFDESLDVLIISGPNTGGKTVTLKILGLFALMVRVGLHVPCGEESEMGFFSSIYADIGDAQDLTKDLSSFSAHITQTVQLLREVADSCEPGDERAAKRPTLVLLDEPVTSTDPTEGAALAAALLVDLARRGLKVAVTTHYRELKALAQSARGFANASVQFDLTTLSPTYRVLMGLPGGSAALDIAGRLGMDESILEDARRRLERDDGLLERLLSEVHERQLRLTEELERAAKARQDAEAAAEAVDKLRSELHASEREHRAQIKRRLTQEFQRARAAIQATLDEMKQERKMEKAKAAKQRLAELETHVRQAVDADLPVAGDYPLAVGSEVELAGLGIAGTLLESPQGKKRVRVRVGDGEVLATVSHLVARPRSQSVSPPPGPSARRISFPLERETRGRDVAAILDVRGKTADETLELVTAALDGATLSGEPLVRIIHGYGTGRLKSVLRDYLSRSPYVARFRPGERAEGGDGVTVVELK